MDIQVNGKRAFAATGGKPFDKDAPVTIFIHGASFDHTVWKLQARYFAWHGGAVLAVDLPGHGRSEGPLLTSIEAMADWVIALMDAAGVEQATLIGHSMGALVTIDTAARYGSRVRALGLAGAAMAIPVNDVLLDTSAANDHLALDLLNAWGYGRRAQFGGHAMPGMWMMRGGLRLLEQAEKDVLHNDLKATNAYQAGAARAAEITCPTVVVIAEKDMMTPAKAGKALAQTIPDAQAAFIPAVGHIMLEEAPDETLDALRPLA
jgi:pimeloyl-ACP methyl ester carboxylesterase